MIKNQKVKISCEKKLSSRSKSDLLVIPVWTEKKKVCFGQIPKEWSDSVENLLNTKDFTGSANESMILYGKGAKEDRLALVSLGPKGKISNEVILQAFTSFGSKLKKLSINSLATTLPIRLGVNLEDCAETVTFSLLFSTYCFEDHKGKKEKKGTQLSNIILLDCDKKGLEKAENVEKVCRGVTLCRDMINSNADHMTPQQFGVIAKDIAKLKGVKTKVYNKKWLEKEGMGLILAVNKGSCQTDPALIVAEYKGAPKGKNHTVLVGKGITFDTGGLNLKPTGSMESMKSDMSGAAIVLSTLYVAALLQLKVNITVVIPSTENAIGSESFKPGDVYTSYTGKTVEIGNTDAEGRLVLADAIAWSEKNLKPTKIIDVATLTGAMAVALGSSCAGFFTRDDSLSQQLLEASKYSCEKLWHMPLVDDYKSFLKSDVADTNNIGKREGGAITAALFLEQFVSEAVSWAHMDVAGVAYNKQPVGHYPKNATGYGVRLLIEFLKNHG